jgi:thimet oligopeptidase
MKTQLNSRLLPKKIRLELPHFEQSAEEVLTTAATVIKKSKNAIEELKKLSTSEVNFTSSFIRLDEIEHEEAMAAYRLYLLQNVHPDPQVREAARKVHLDFENWSIERAFDEELYKLLCLENAQIGAQSIEEKKVVEDIMRDYKRRGMNLPSEKKQELQDLKKKLSALELKFSSNILEHQDFLSLTETELQGLENSFIQSLKKEATGRYLVSLEYPEFFPVMEYCESEEVRKFLLTKKYQTAAKSNPQILREMVEIRAQIARLLGYSSWNHFVIEDRMAKDPQKVESFLIDLKNRLASLAKSEIEELTALKREHTQNPEAKIEAWDYYFYNSRLKRKKHQIDNQEIKAYFTLEEVIQGMFEIVGDLFSLEFQEQSQGSFPTWHEDVKLVQVLEKETKAPIGWFYLDLHPRAGKYNHAAAFGLIAGRLHSDESYQAPISVMVCNFPRATKETPSLMPHSEIETLFHEFGHILHGVLTQARFARFAGTSVAWDFVEAPSQIMENWAWQKEGLKKISKHYKTKQSLSEEMIQKMNAAKKTGLALFYLRQISFALADLKIHSQSEHDPVTLANDVIASLFLAPPPNTSFAAGWGHMVGYASGYYGYAWADVMAADLFSKFNESHAMNPDLGKKLRREIFEIGSSRDENQSLESFLGRPLSSSAFFKELGIEAHV